VAGKNDFVLKLGFKIDSKSISKTALRAALTKAAEGLVLKISKVKLASPSKIRADITKQIGTVKIDNLTVSARASKAFAKSINDKVRPQIKGLTVSPQSLANLRKSVERALSNVRVRTAGAGAAGGGRGAAGGARGASSASRQASAEQNLAQAIQQRKAALINANRIEQKAIQSMNTQQKAAIRLTQTLRQSGLSFQEVGAKVAQVTKRFTEYTLSVKGLQAGQAVIRTATEGIRELDDATRDLAKVGSVGEDINLAFAAISTTALSTGRSVKDAGDAIGEFVRQGKDLTTAAKFAADALKLTNISSLNAANSARLVTAAQQVFGITTSELGAKLSSLAVFADSSATNVGEIGTAFLRTASSADAAGLTIETTFAILASTLEQTRLNASTVGTAFKTIFARLGRDRGKVAALSNDFLGLKEGADGFLAAGLPINEFLPQLAANFGKLSSDQKNSIALQVAGVRQANVFIAALENWDKSQDLLNNTQNDATELTKKNAEQLKKLSTRAQQVSVAVKVAAGAIAGLGEGNQGGVAGIFGASLDGIRDTTLLIPTIVQGLNDMSGEGLKFGSILSTGLLGAFAGVVGTIMPAMINGLRQMTGLTKQLGTAAQGENAELRRGTQEREKAVAAEKQILGIRQRIVALATKTAVGLKSSPILNGLGRTIGAGGARGGKDPSGSQLKGGAAAGAALFALSDVANQLSEDLEDNTFGKNMVAAGTQAATMGAFLGPLGVVIGLATSTITAFTKALSETKALVEEANIAGLSDQIQGIVNNVRLDSSDATRIAEDLISSMNDALVNQIAAGGITDSFTKTLNETMNNLTVGLRATFLELEGIPSEAARLMAEIENTKSQVSGLTAHSIGGATLVGQDAISEIIAGRVDSVDVTNEKIEALIKQREGAESTLQEILKEQKGADDAFSEVLTALREAVAGTTSEGSGKSLGDTLFREGVKRRANEAKELASTGFQSTPQGGSDIRAAGRIGNVVDEISQQKLVNEALGISLILDNERLSEKQKLEGVQRAIAELEKGDNQSRAAYTEKLARLHATIGTLNKAEAEEKKDSLKFLEEEVNRQVKIEKLLEQGADRAKVASILISKENEKLKTKIASEQRISELKNGTLDQQIQAVLEEKKLGLVQNDNLKNIEKQIGLLKIHGKSTTELEETKRQALSDLDQRARLDASPDVKKLVDAEAEKNRKTALESINTATKSVNDTDGARAKVLSKLQSSNKKVIDLEKRVSQEGGKVSEVMLSIAGAQANLSNVIQQSFATIRSSVRTALSSGGFDNVASVATSLGAVLSLEQRLNVLRREGLEESLRISQEQAKTLLSIGERLATGGPGARQDAIRGISTAQAIQGGADISSFTPSDLKLALGVENLFPGLKEAVSTQALVTLGLDDELASLRANIVGAAGGLAEADAKKQIDVASASLSAQLQTLVEAKNAQNIAQDDLSLSRDAAAADKSKLDIARAQVALSAQNLTQVEFQNRNLLDIKNTIAGGGVAGISNAARGTLSGPELRGLEAAAMREKSLMPAGSRLMLANTSETVLTRRQSKQMGLEPKRKSNAANGNADVGGLATLMAQVVSKLDQLNSSIKTGGVNNVNLQVDTNKSINVRGIEGLGQRLESELKGKFAAGGDVAAVESAILEIITKLGESGLADDLGR